VPVLDASCAIELVLDRGGKAPVLEALGGERADAPEIIHLEALQALRGLVRGGRIPLAHASGAVRRLGTLKIGSHGHGPLRSRVWTLRDRCSAYDAAYVALAERLDTRLVTADGRLARGVGDLVQVVVVDC
jgi:predicted nucleic acid-binding protein